MCAFSVPEFAPPVTAAAFKPSPRCCSGPGLAHTPPPHSSQPCRSGGPTLPTKERKLAAREGRCLLSASSAMPQGCPFRYRMSPVARRPVLLGAGRGTPDSSSVTGREPTGQLPAVGPWAGAFASAPQCHHLRSGSSVFQCKDRVGRALKEPAA